jgi:hypothetical protein
MKTRHLGKWALVCSLFLALFILGSPSQRVWAQTTQNCLECHKGRAWPDNNAGQKDIDAKNATSDYLPLNLSSSNIRPFYDIKSAYTKSIHATPAFAPDETDYLTCLGCHVSLPEAHSGKIVGTNKCAQCHQLPFFDLDAYKTTSHFNPDSTPPKYFDQWGSGTSQALAYLSAEGESVLGASLLGGPVLGEPVSLFKSDKKSIVTKNSRIDECSVCHNYVLQYPRYKAKYSKPQVGCPSCHDAHMPAPSAKDIPVVNSTVNVTSIYTSSSGSITPLTVERADGREMAYMNLKPYKQDATGAQNKSGTWTRGSSFTRPNSIIVQGTGTVGDIVDDGGGTSTRFTFAGIGKKVKAHDTLFISGVAEGTATLPADALSDGDVTVRATLDRAGFGIASVVDDNTVELDPGVVATATVTYKKDPTGTGTKSVSIPFSGGPFTFEVRNMQTNTETLCSSCHTQGKYKFSAWGKKQDGGFIDLKQTHNSNASTQYANSGHANILALAFDEFSARPYGTSHVTTYPFDMSITGSGGVGSLRNKGNTLFDLIAAPESNNFANAYLTKAGNTSLPPLVNNYACFQCHNGLGTIDYLKGRQGTTDAQVLWGDANVTCLTCHDTHEEGAGANVRIPVKLSYNSRFVDSVKNPKGGINKFMDGTDIPAEVGKGNLCLFCHQGRESGLTVYLAIKGKVDPYTNPDQVIDAANGISFINPHYLDSGAILWGRNAWEYIFGGTPQEYSTGVPAHQSLNCMGCHMAEPNAENTEGGHTWRPRVETCQECHGSFVTDFKDIPAIGDYDGDGEVKTAFEEIGTLGDPVLGDSGLFGKLKTALHDAGIDYDPDSYPYFFNASGGQYKAWTSNQLSAAFNLAWAYKSGIDCVAYHNAYYGAQILQDSLKALRVDTSGYFRPPVGLRNATDYRTIVVNP